MCLYNVAETFVSINGEGKKAGQLSYFIRLCGCNLSCSYCDTTWANEKDVKYSAFSAEEIYDKVISSGVKNVTLTGGEPLLNPNIRTLLDYLCSNTEIKVEVETNGSIPIKRFFDVNSVNPPTFTVDYKLPSSMMEKKMCMENFECVRNIDTVKFVAGSTQDLEKALEVINRFHLTEKCSVYISPVFGNINPERIVNFMIENKLNNVNLQLQLHKFIWPPETRGV